MSATFFISYRRREALVEARAVCERLARAFGEEQVFIDLKGLDYGVDFVRSLETHLHRCRVVLALIGPEWLSAADTQGRRRLDDAGDFVRIELRTALQRDIPVIPVLLGGTPMPGPDDLPDDLQALVRRQAFQLDFHRFDADMDQLVGRLRKQLAAEPGAAEEPSTPPAPSAPAGLTAQPAQSAQPVKAGKAATPQVGTDTDAGPAPARPPKRPRRSAAAASSVAAAAGATRVPTAPASWWSRALGSLWSWSSLAAGLAWVGWNVTDGFGLNQPASTAAPTAVAPARVTPVPAPTAALPASRAPTVLRAASGILIRQQGVVVVPTHRLSIAASGSVTRQGTSEPGGARAAD